MLLRSTDTDTLRAYELLKYQSEDGEETWFFWNSRDGVTPFSCCSPKTGIGLLHTDWGRDAYRPAHVPRPGDWIWVDMTQERMQELAEKQADEGPVKAGDDRYDREGWVKVFLENFHAGEPDLVQVTEEMHQKFFARYEAIAGSLGMVLMRSPGGSGRFA